MLSNLIRQDLVREAIQLVEERRLLQSPVPQSVGRRYASILKKAKSFGIIDDEKSQVGSLEE